MNWWVLIAVAALILLGYLAYRFGWIDLSDKTRKRSGSSGSSIVGIGDEVFAPTRHEAQIELDRQSMLPAPAPLAGDGDKGIFDGKITIDLATSSAPRSRSGGRHSAEPQDATGSEESDSRDAR